MSARIPNIFVNASQVCRFNPHAQRPIPLKTAADALELFYHSADKGALRMPFFERPKGSAQTTMRTALSVDLTDRAIRKTAGYFINSAQARSLGKVTEIEVGLGADGTPWRAARFMGIPKQLYRNDHSRRVIFTNGRNPLRMVTVEQKPTERETTIRTAFNWGNCIESQEVYLKAGEPRVYGYSLDFPNLTAAFMVLGLNIATVHTPFAMMRAIYAKFLEANIYDLTDEVALLTEKIIEREVSKSEFSGTIFLDDKSEQRVNNIFPHYDGPEGAMMSFFVGAYNSILLTQGRLRIHFGSESPIPVVSGTPIGDALSSKLEALDGFTF